MTPPATRYRAITEGASLDAESDGGLLCLAAIGLRRYSVEPETRTSAARLLLIGALALFVRHAGRAEAARVCLHILGDR